MIDPDQLMSWVFPVVEQAYTVEDTMAYALAIGLGEAPEDERQLRYVTEYAPGTPEVLPTMAVVLGYPGSWMANPATGIDFGRIVHGEEEVTLHDRIPSSGTVKATHEVIEIVDKGVGRGATITYDKRLHDVATGTLLATVRHKTFARGDGGFSSPAPRPTADVPPLLPVPDRKPDYIRTMHSLPQQALLYRLLADRNPLHADPATAAAAGFERPIMHGLCTFGIAGHALLAELCAYDSGQMKAISARFSAPVFPGEPLTVEIFREETHVAFRVLAEARAKVVLSHGRAIIK